jgi:hypothetical protein
LDQVAGTRRVKYLAENALLRIVMEEIYRLVTRDRPGLLFAMMHALAAEDSRISFEGRLTKTDLAKMECAVFMEIGVLKRATLQPQLDFIVLPLTQQNVSPIEKAVNSKIAFGEGGIIHVQIEKNEKMAFAAYDNFHREYVVAYPPVNPALLDKLVEARVLRNYERALQPCS